MSQAERVSRIHFLLKTRGRVTVAEVREEFEVSRATVMRDIELMRDRLFAPIRYDLATNAYIYDEASPVFRRGRGTAFELPGLWISEDEAYALLTIVNVLGKVDPGALMPHAAPLRLVLKNLLCDRRFPMKGFHRKVAVELPNLHAGPRAVAAMMSQALVDEVRAILTWKDVDGSIQSGTASIQRFILGSNGWEADIVDATGNRLRIPLHWFTACTLTQARAVLLPEFRSSPDEDRDALYKLLHRREIVRHLLDVDQIEEG